MTIPGEVCVIVLCWIIMGLSVPLTNLIDPVDRPPGRRVVLAGRGFND